MNNPIKDNRIVNDITFATRLNQFLEWLPSEYILSECCIYEEYNYLKMVAGKLKKYQIITAESEEEKKYLKTVYE